ncbi:hypothetical protein TIFTF001_053013, partial [Ficus carica]
SLNEIVGDPRSNSPSEIELTERSSNIQFETSAYVRCRRGISQVGDSDANSRHDVEPSDSDDDE